MRTLDPKDYFSSPLRVFAHASLAQPANLVREKLESLSLRDHVAVFSSGTTSSTLKGYALSLAALKANAKAVNDFYNITQSDVWGLSIPDYHIGGLSVLMRAQLLNQEVIDCRGWDPVTWIKTISESKVTVTTIVPTQVFDLVSNNLRPPSHLRHVIVGGDYLSHKLQRMAEALDWPVRRTFGMTEIASQLASSLKTSELEVLPLHQVKTDHEGRLWVKSPSLFTLQFQVLDEVKIKRLPEFCDPEGFYQTQDRVSLEGNHIQPMGRTDEQIKVAGHMTHLPSLRETLYKILLQTGHYGEAEIQIKSDERKGHRLILIHKELLPSSIIEKIQTALRPYQLDELKAVKSFNRTDLGKLKKT